MDISLDVFAGVNDFCENYTPEAIKLSKSQIDEDGEASDSEAEAFFLNGKGNKPKKQPKEPKVGRRKRGPKAKDTLDRESSSEETEEEPSPPKQGKNQNNKDDYIPDVEEIVIEEVSETGRPKRTVARPTRLVEEYMQRQTAAILQQQVAVVPRRGRGGRRRNTPQTACNAPVVGVIDLAGPKTPPLPAWSRTFSQKTVNLESDDDCNFSSDILNSSFDLENETLSVKVKWGDKIEMVPLRKHQKFVDIMMEFAKKKSVDPKDILLNLNERIIEPDDTPDSINYNIAQFISGRIVPNANQIVPAKKKDPNMIKVKVQSNAFKKPLSVHLRKDQPFKDLYFKCWEELKIPADRIKLSFDGDQLMLGDTPNDLEFEGGEVIDCRITKK